MTTGSISLSGLLGGTAGQIDTTTLISQLMTAAALPQTQLKDQLTSVTNIATAYQSINTKLSAVQTAAQALTDATSVESHRGNVVGRARSWPPARLPRRPGSTTFAVTALASPQITTIVADSSGNVLTDPSAGFTLTIGGVGKPIPAAASASATDTAAAINKANVGVAATVVDTDQGQVLQLTSSTTGAAQAFTLNSADFTNSPQQVLPASDAQVTVGTVGAGGYTKSSSTNTFTSLDPRRHVLGQRPGTEGHDLDHQRHAVDQRQGQCARRRGEQRDQRDRHATPGRAPYCRAAPTSCRSRPRSRPR